MPLSFLLPEKVSVPTGGEFVPSGLIGMWMGTVLFSFYSTVDLTPEYQAAGEKFLGNKRKQGANGYRYYLKTLEQFKHALELSGTELKGAPKVWNFQAESERVFNITDEGRNKFGDLITFDVSISSLSAQWENHYPFQLFALPAAVAAAAKVLGLPHADYTLNDLLDNQIIYDDNFQARMIGNPDIKHTESELWKRRTALWAALGESDPSTYTTDTGKKTDTKSKQLGDCLGILLQPWSGSFPIRLLSVPDPRVGATFKGANSDTSKRLTIPTIAEIFQDEKTAKTAAVKELAEREARKEGKAGNGATESTAGGLTLPEAWKGMQDEFVVSVKETVKKPLKVAAKELEVTAEELSAWREKVAA